MKNFFSPDSLFSQALTYFVNIVILNLLMLVCSIPVITIGASLTAGFYAARKDIMMQGHLVKNFFTAFRDNFRQATLIWCVLAPVGLLLALSALLIRVNLLIPFQLACALLWFAVFVWVWPLQSSFKNSVGKTLAHAFIVGLGKLQYTFVLLAIPALFSLVVYLSWRWFTSGLFLLFLCGAGLIMYAQAKPAQLVMDQIAAQQ